VVYDMTENEVYYAQTPPVPGFDIITCCKTNIITYEIYTDDGRGNGDYVTTCSDIYWARRIAYSLDEVGSKPFDYNGNWKTDY